MRWWVMVAALLAAVVAFTAPRSVEAQDTAEASDCMDLPLGPVPEWDMVALGDVNWEGGGGGGGGAGGALGAVNWKAGENEGRAVVGRDATFESFGVGNRLPTDRTRLDLAVGRNLR